MTQFPILSVIIFTPIVGALIALALPRRAAWGWGVLVALIDLALSLALLAMTNTGSAGYQFIESARWLPDLGISYSLGVDGLSLFLLGLNALITLVALIASWPQAQVGDRIRSYVALMLLLAGAMQGVFLATNVFLFYIFWELMLVPAYLLVGMFGGPRRAAAAIKFVLYTAVSSLLMLVGIIWMGYIVSSASAAPFTLDLPTLLAEGVPASAQGILFFAFMAAFAVKSGLFPLHGWAPDVYVEAPAPVTAVVAGVMAKTAIYGMLRIVAPLFPTAMRNYFPLIGTMAVVGILYFALQALVSNDFKRLLAYVSLSHMGVIVLGVFALNAQGIQGAILQMVNHGIVIAALFLIAAAIETRIGSRRLGEFGALATRLPWLATAFLIATMAALGLPGLNSFAGEFLAFLGAFHANWVYGAVATLVVIPAAWYMLRFFQGVMEGQRPESGPVASALSGASAKLVDLRWQEWLALIPLIALIFYLGIVPATMTSRTEAATQQILVTTQQAAPSAHNASQGG
ncbi:MAG TPA: NADH-quinone oxidoreductase subunit M [Ktedonobacterales bacterium]|nr:NADH-quinone oxidoreductase subunit M [Ktedonobacterales bacterium]